MSKPTQQQRDTFRFLLEDRGVPEVLAFMAARNISWGNFDSAGSTGTLVGGFFNWHESPEGWDFWLAVYACAKEAQS